MEPEAPFSPSLLKFLRIQQRFWWAIALTGLAIAAIGLYFAKGLSLNTNLESLLPKNSSIVQNLQTVAKKSGGSHDFRLLISGAPIEKLLEAAQAFQDYAQQHKDFFRSTQYRTPKQFFEDHKLKLIPLESLEVIHRRVEEERKKNPDVSDPLGLESSLAEEEEKNAAAPESAPPSETSSQNDDEEMKSAKELLDRLDTMKPYYQTGDGEFLAIRIIPEAESIDLNKNRSLLKGLQSHLNAFDFKKLDPNIRYTIMGSIPDHLERYDSIIRDVSFGGLGIIAIILIVVFYFSSLWAVSTLVPPLLTGLSLGLGIVALTEKTLNTIAVFLVVVVFGVGIEFGVHLWARFLQERALGHNPLESLIRTWNSTGRATITSALALLTGFALLTLSTFQGFAQFGRVAIVLLTCVAGSFLVFMPAWILVTEHFRSKRFKGPRIDFAAQISKRVASKLPRSTAAVIRVVSTMIVLASVALSAWKLSFDYRFEERITGKAVSTERKVQGQIFTERLKPSAVAVFPLEKDAAQFLEYYRKNKSRFPDIALMSGLPTFLPTNQEERIKRLQEISDLYEVSWLKNFKDEDIRRILKEIKRNAYILRPHTDADLPPELRDPFMSSDGRGEYLVFIFDIGGETDGRKAMKFSDAVELFQQEAGLHPLIGGQELVFSDIVRGVVQEGPFLVLGMFFLIFIICWLDFRRLSHSLITMLPVAAGFAMTGAVMVLTGRQINFFNMVALASLGSMVVDNSIHLYHRYLELRGKPNAVERAGISVAPSIFTCTLTSLCGYGGMWLANHSGVSSLGFVADIGLMCCFVSSVIFFPAWLAWREGRYSS